MKKIISVLIVIVMLFSLPSCNTGKEEHKQYKTRSRTISEYYFNTFSTVSTYKDESDLPKESYAKAAEDILEYYHKLFDIYFEYDGMNNLCTINKNAGKSPVKVDEEMIVFLEYCKELYTITGGKTNVMLGSVLEIWHDTREDALDDFGYLHPDELPTLDELRKANEHTSIDLLVIDKEASTVYISDRKAAIDVGAIAKGYTVDILAERIGALGADSVALNIGGNIRTIGLKPEAQPWVIGLTNPDKTSDDSLYCRVQIGSSSMVTSGNYERFFYAGETKYHHIIDPATLMPAAYFSSVTIITENSGLADALSTALFCMSYEDGLALVNSIGGVEVIWIDLNYNMKATEGIKTLPIK
jgi:thiamine biosynthesis lipoprotein